MLKSSKVMLKKVMLIAILIVSGALSAQEIQRNQDIKILNFSTSQIFLKERSNPKSFKYFMAFKNEKTSTVVFRTDKQVIKFFENLLTMTKEKDGARVRINKEGVVYDIAKMGDDILVLAKDRGYVWLSNLEIALMYSKVYRHINGKLASK